MMWRMFGGMTMRVPSNLMASILSRTCHTSLFFYSASNISPPGIGASSLHLNLQGIILIIVYCHFHHHLSFLPSTLKLITLTRYGITLELWDMRHKYCLPLAIRRIHEMSARAWKVWNSWLRYTGWKHHELGRERSLRWHARSQSRTMVSMGTY